MRRCTCWMKLRLEVFIQCDVLSCPCKTTTTAETTQSKRYEEFCRFEHLRTGWSTCIVHANITHVCIAVLTGSGFISLSSVFISDGCTPLRLTPYATHRRPCTKNQTSQIHTQNGIRIDTCSHSSPLSVHTSLHRNPVNRPLSLTIHV